MEVAVTFGHTLKNSFIVSAPLEGKVAAVALGRAEFFKRVVSGLDDPSEEPQAETTSADTSKNTAERFFIETTFFRMH